MTVDTLFQYEDTSSGHSVYQTGVQSSALLRQRFLGVRSSFISRCGR